MHTCLHARACMDTQAFQWPVWLALGGTAICVSMLVTIAEVLTYGSGANRHAGKRQQCALCMACRQHG